MKVRSQQSFPGTTFVKVPKSPLSYSPENNFPQEVRRTLKPKKLQSLLTERPSCNFKAFQTPKHSVGMKSKKGLFEYRCFQFEKRGVERSDEQTECKSEEEDVLDEMFSDLSTRKTLANDHISTTSLITQSQQISENSQL